MSGRTAVVVGGIGKLPYAGMTFHYLHYVLGLTELGYDVHYVERQNRAQETYDPTRDEMTDRPDTALRHLDGVMRRFGQARRWSFIDRTGAAHGTGWSELRRILAAADFVLTVADPTWFDELDLCERRLFVDGDPMFTQVALSEGQGTRSVAPDHYDTLFTFASRIGAPDCLVPTCGRHWIPTRPVVATAHWERTAAPADAPIVALMHWAAGKELRYDGRDFGHKDREFEKIIDLPRARPGTYELAAGGAGVPRDRLDEHGWRLVSPLAVSGTIDDFTRFIAGSRADLGVAKHAYVASRSGWFSDRSTCFLAAGRPVLHQDTGYTDWLPDDAGVLAFADLDSLGDALDRLDRDYERHAEAARAIAETRFEARVVLSEMLDAAAVR